MKLCPYIVRLFALAITFTPLTVTHVAAQESVLATDYDISGWVVGFEYVAAPEPFVGDAESASRFVPVIGYVGERLTWLGL